jgi:4'-phosphopantetheinyl transferase EntD
MTYFATLLNSRIAVAEAPLRGGLPDLPAEHAVPCRQLEFATGRECARQAIAALGRAKTSLPRVPDRVPIWRDDLVGSITHTRDPVAAVVAQRDHGFATIGIDLEPATALLPDLWVSICTASPCTSFSA